MSIKTICDIRNIPLFLDISRLFSIHQNIESFCILNVPPISEVFGIRFKDHKKDMPFFLDQNFNAVFFKENTLYNFNTHNVILSNIILKFPNIVDVFPRALCQYGSKIIIRRNKTLTISRTEYSR